MTVDATSYINNHYEFSKEEKRLTKFIGMWSL